MTTAPLASVACALLPLLSIACAARTATDPDALRKAVFMYVGADCPDPKVRTLRAELVEAGGACFPACQEVLADAGPRNSDLRLSRTLNLLAMIDTDAGRFADPAIRLGVERPKVRRSVARFLGRHGRDRDLSYLVALLYNTDSDSLYAAAEALAKIGTEREVAAMDIWVGGSITAQGNAQIRAHVERCRDDLKRRLAQAKPPGK